MSEWCGLIIDKSKFLQRTPSVSQTKSNQTKVDQTKVSQTKMSAKELTDRLLEAIRKETFDFIVVNFANPDMVGHTGNLRAAIQAVETVDYCIGRVVKGLKKVGGTMFLTADHGNCEKMLDFDTGTPHTAHTTNFVPTVLVNGPPNVTALTTGRLADVAPTLLELMEIPIPTSMNGTSMLSNLRN